MEKGIGLGTTTALASPRINNAEKGIHSISFEPNSKRIKI